MNACTHKSTQEIYKHISERKCTGCNSGEHWAVKLQKLNQVCLKTSTRVLFNLLCSFMNLFKEEQIIDS